MFPSISMMFVFKAEIRGKGDLGLGKHTTKFGFTSARGGQKRFSITRRKFGT